MAKHENDDIRKAAKDAGIYLWQVAEKLGLRDNNFSRKLRHELPDGEKVTILRIIAELSKEV